MCMSIPHIARFIHTMCMSISHIARFILSLCATPFSCGGALWTLCERFQRPDLLVDSARSPALAAASLPQNVLRAVSRMPLLDDEDVKVCWRPVETVAIGGAVPSLCPVFFARTMSSRSFGDPGS